MQDQVRRSLPFVLSLVAGMALWEIVGRNSSPAFLVPLSATLERLWELLIGGTLLAQTLDSARLFLTGLVASIVVGVPAGLMLARVPVLRVAIEPYIMLLYATPMVALIPFILSLMGFGFAAQGAGGVSVRRLPHPLQHGRRRAQHQAGNDRSRALLPLRRMVAVARDHAALHAALHHDRRPAGDRPCVWSAWWRRNSSCRPTVSASSS